MTELLTSTIASSSDGVPIEYVSLGSGPDVVLVHGAMQSATSQLDLARLLAPRFRVHLANRRGRGGSGAYPSGAGTAVEIGDLIDVLSSTGARRVLGISSGAIIAARAALASDRVGRLALFEPPISIDGSIRLEMITMVEAAYAQGDQARGLAYGMKVAEMGPPWLFRLPIGMLAAGSRRMLATPEGRALAAALPVDLRVVAENADAVSDFAALAAPTLVIDGTRTRPYLRRAAAALAAMIPNARRFEVAGATHVVTQNRAERGDPSRIAAALAGFFAE